MEEYKKSSFQEKIDYFNDDFFDEKEFQNLQDFDDEDFSEPEDDAGFKYLEQQDEKDLFFCENDNQGDCKFFCICEDLFVFEEIIEDTPQELTEEEKQEQLRLNKLHFKIYDWNQIRRPEVSTNPDFLKQEKKEFVKMPRMKNQKKLNVKIRHVREGMPSTINFARVKKILEQEGRKVNSVSSTPSAPKPHLPCRFWSKCRKDTCGFSHTEEELKKNIRKCVNESCGDIEVKILKIKRDGKTFAARKICNKEGRRVCHFIHEKETLQCFLKRVFEGYQNALEAKRSEANRTTTPKATPKAEAKAKKPKAKKVKHSPT